MLERWNRWRKALRAPPGLRFALAWHSLSAALGLVISLLLIAFEPFDLDSGIAARGRDAFYEVAAFAYPEARSPRTFVTLLDDAYLRQSHGVWPVPYAVHAGAVETIAAQHPRAIVIDFLFLDERPDNSFGFFLRTLSRVAEEIPIYIIAAPRGEIGRRARPDLEALVASDPNISFVSVEPGREIGGGPSYPLKASAGEPRPLAAALYEDLCAVPGTCAPTEGDMDIWWAVPRHDTFNCRGAKKQICERMPHSAIERAYSLATGLIGGLLPKSWRPLNPVEVPYAPTVGLGDVFVGDAKITERMESAVVFYGSSLAFAGDNEDTPTQGLVPSVHAHAMAYDNLVALGGRYIHAEPPFDWDPKLHMAVLTCLLALAGFAARLLLTWRRPHLAARAHRRERVFGPLDSTVFILGALTIAVLEFNVGRIGPWAWAPVLAAVAAGDFLSSRSWGGALMVRIAKALRPKPPASPEPAPSDTEKPAEESGGRP